MLTSAGSTPAQADGLDFADVAAAIATLADAPAAEEPRAAAPQPKAEAPKPAPAKAAASKPAEDKKPVASKKPAAEKKAAAPKEPSRIWVQLAASQNKAAFPAEFKRLKAKAPDLFKGKSAWTAPSRASNRLLVGPFETDKEAREFVNGLSKASIESFSWKSEAGQAVEKLPAK